MKTLEEIDKLIEEEYQRKLNLGIGCSNGFCDILGERKGLQTNSTCSCLSGFGKENQIAIRRRLQMKDMIINFLLNEIKGDEIWLKIFELNRRI